MKKQERQAVTHGAGLQLKEKDFHAKPYCVIHNDECLNPPVGTTHSYVFSKKDVLAEREHYQKRISFLESSVKRLITRAEAAEAELKKAIESHACEIRVYEKALEVETKSVNAEKHNVEVWVEETERLKGVCGIWKDKFDKAEARIAELEAELKRERNWSKYETKQVKARDKTIKALVGEKTK